MESVLGTNQVMQICIIVKNVEETKKKYAEFFGLPVPETADAGKFETTGVTYEGKPDPRINCKMASFNLSEDLSLEVLQPVGGVPSEWQNFLDTYGEGVHHIAFHVKDTQGKIKEMKKAGYEVTQMGKYGDGSGCYSYFTTREDLKTTIELLEWF